MLIDNQSPFFESVIACPISKEPLRREGDALIAPCGFRYTDGDLRVGLDYSEDWRAGQKAYEAHYQRWVRRNDFAAIDAETESVYADIKMSGNVLDVAGGFGSVAKQAALDSQTYICLDAIPFRWRDFSHHQPFASHYAECASLCRVPAFAEFLPIRSGVMDFIHMRSCIDHFANPLLALKEAYRVLKASGSVIIGISLEGAYRKNAPRGREQLKAFVKRNWLLRETYERLFDHHIFHPTRESLCDLVRRAGFEPSKEHWQAGYHNVLYLTARKN